MAAALSCAVPILVASFAFSGGAAAATNNSPNPVPGDQTTFTTAVDHCYDTYTVPDQVTQIEVQAVGADGTDGQNNIFDGTAAASFEGAGSGELGQIQPGGQSGRGAEVDTTLSVTPGEQLYVGPSSIAFGGGVGGLAGMYYQPTSSTDQAAQPGAGGAGGNASFISTSPPSTANGTCSFSPAQLKNDILVVAAGGGGGGGAGSGEDDVLTNGLRAQDPGGAGGSELGTPAQAGGGSMWQSISTTDPLNQSGDQDEGTAGSNATSTGGGTSGSGGFSVSVINDWRNNLGKLFNAGVICIPGSSGGAGGTSGGGAGGAAAQSGLYGNPTDMSSVQDLSQFLAAEGESTSSESLGSLSTVAGVANVLINYLLSDPNEPTVWITGCGGEDADPSWSLRPDTAGMTQIIPGLSSGGGGGGGGGYYSGGGGGGADDFYINAGGGGGGAGSSYVQGQSASATAADTSVPSGDAGVTLIPLETPPTITAVSPTVNCTIGQYCSGELDTTGVPIPQVGFASVNAQLPAGLAFGADNDVTAAPGTAEVAGSATDCSSVGTHTYSNQIEAINAAGSAMLPSLSIDISPGVMQDIRLNTVSGNPTSMVAGDPPTPITALADYPSCSYDVSGSSAGTWSVSGSEGTGGGSVSNSSVVTLSAVTGQSSSDDQENIVPVAPGSATVNFSYTDPWGKTLTQKETVTVTHGAPHQIWFENGQCTTASDASTGLTLVPGQLGSPKVCADFGNSDIEDVTNLAHWEGIPSGLSVAGVTVSSNGVTAGTPQGIGAGELSETGDVTAYLGAQTASLPVTVNFGDPSSILIQNNAAPAGGLAPGGTEQLSALATYGNYGVYADVTKLANWSSNDTDRALIVQNGNSGGDLTVPSYTLGGQVTVSATLGSATGTFITQIPVGTPDTLSVSDASGNVGSDTVDLGTSEQLEAIGAVGADTDNVNSQTTWTSSNPQAVTVTSSGVVAAVGPDYGGPVQIIANDNNVTTTYEVTVGLSHPQIISITPKNPTVPLGSQVQLTATGYYGSGNYTADITSLVNWSAPSALGTVTSTGMLNTKGTNSQGLSDPVTASLGGVSGQTTITEQGQAPNGITVTGSKGTLQLGASEQLTATANFDDNSTSDVTPTVTWSSDNSNLFTVTSSGVVTAVGATGGGGGGLQANVRATLNYSNGSGTTEAISGTDFLTVSLANPNSITITPPATNVFGNSGFAFTATGYYGNGSYTADLSYIANWNTTNSAATSFSGNELSTQAISAPSSTTVTASYSGVTGTLAVPLSGPLTLTGPSGGTSSLTGTVGTAYTYTFSVAGGSGDYKWQIIDPDTQVATTNTDVSLSTTSGGSVTVIYTPSAADYTNNNPSGTSGRPDLFIVEATDTATNQSLNQDVDVTLNRQAQNLSWVQTLPAAASYGSSLFLSGTSSAGLQTTISSVGDGDGCTVSGNQVSFNVSYNGVCQIQLSQAGSGTYSPAAITATIDVSVPSGFTWAPSQPPPGEGQVANTDGLFWAEPNNSNPQDPGAVTYSIDPATTNSACHIDQTTQYGVFVKWDKIGSCVVDANIAAASDSDGFTFTAATVQSVVPVVGQTSYLLFQSSSPSGKAVGQTYTPTFQTMVGGLDDPSQTISPATPQVTIDTADSSPSNACATDGTMVTFTHAGTCVIGGEQPATSQFSQINALSSQTITVGPGSQAITFPGATASSYIPGSSTTLTPTGGKSGNAVVLSVDNSSTDTANPGSEPCSVSGDTVSFNDAGTCVIDANQASNADYGQAQQAQKTFKIQNGQIALVSPGLVCSAHDDSGDCTGTYQPPALTATASNDPQTQVLVELENAAGSLVSATGNVTVNLAGDGHPEFQDAAGNTINQITIPANSFYAVVYYGNTQAGAQAISATAALPNPAQTPISSSPASVTVSAGPIASLQWETEPTDGNVGQTMGQFSLVAVDAYGNAVSGAPVTLTATNMATGVSQAIAQGATGTTANNPNAGDPADFNGVVFDKAGTYELTASAGGVSSIGPSQAFTIAPGPVTNLSFTTAPVNAASGQPMPTIKVEALDSHNDPIPNANVTLTVNNGGEITGSSQQTGAEGFAEFDTTTVSPAGSYTMTATSGGVTQTSGPFTITKPASLASLKWRSQPSDVTAGQSMSPISVEALDTSGSPLLGVPVKLTATDVATGKTVTINQDPLASTVADATEGDLATFNTFTIDRAGTYTLTATSGGVSSTSSQQFTVAAAPVSSLSFASQPADGSAGVPITGPSVQASDAFGNPVIGAPVTLTAADATSGNAVTITADSSENTVSDPTHGDLATFKNLTIDALGTDTLTATSNGQSITSSAFTIATGPVGQLSFIGQPSDVVAGHQMPQVSVQAEDAGGNPVTGADVTLTATNVNTHQTVSASSDGTETTYSDSTYGDLASFFDLTIDTGGTYTLTASSHGVSATSAQFSVSVDTVDSLMFASNLNSVVAGQPISPVQVQALNGNGQRVIGAPVTITATNVTSGDTVTVGGDSTENTAQNDQYGDLATFSNLTLDQAGTYTLTATSAGISLTTAQQLTVTPAAVSALQFTEPPTDSVAGEAIPEVQVLATDQYGNPVPNASVTLGVNHGEAVTGIYNPSENTAQTDQFGDATFDYATVDAPGTYTMTATSGSASENSLSTFKVSGDPVGSLMFATKPTDVVAGQPITPAVQVQALDATSRTDLGAPITLTATNVATGDTVTIDQDATENTVSESPYGDLATFSDLTINTPGTYQLTASSGGASLQDDRQFTVSAGAVSHLTFSAQPTGTTAGAALPQIKVLATDSIGNPVPGASVTLSVNNSGTVINDAATTGGNGYATFDSATIDQAGTYTLTANSKGVSVASTSTFAVSAGAVHALSFAAEPAGAVTGKTLPTIKVQASDSVGNPVPGANVTLSVDGGGKITGATETTGNDGTAIFDDATITPAGTYTLTATSGNVTTASTQVTISPVVVPPVSTALTITAPPSPAVYGKAIKVTGTLTAAGKDLSGQTVTLLYRKAGSTGAYSKFATTAKSSASGAVSFTTFKPATPVQVELSYAGSSSSQAAYDSSTSASKNVAEERVLTISAPKSAGKGKTVKFTGAVTPKQTGLTVYLQRKSGASWKAAGSAKLTAAGKYSIKLKLATKGTLTYRVLVKTSSGFSQSISTTRSVRVT